VTLDRRVANTLHYAWTTEMLSVMVRAYAPTGLKLCAWLHATSIRKLLHHQHPGSIVWGAPNGHAEPLGMRQMWWSRECGGWKSEAVVSVSRCEI